MNLDPQQKDSVREILCDPAKRREWNDWAWKQRRRGSDAASDFMHNDLFGINLGGVDLRNADLHDAALVDAGLRRANLRGANLRGADLRNASLIAADLTDADLTGAQLRWANLDSANFGGANLSGADLRNANLTQANLRGAQASKAKLGDTILSAVHLGALCRGDVDVSAQCYVDCMSVMASLQEPTLKDFLYKVGVPNVFSEYMIDCARSLAPDLIFSLLQSTFISFGGPDEAFAQKLNNALKANGVHTFFFKDDAKVGDELQQVMRNGVNSHDRVILICSEHSLRRPGLLNELTETLRREARDGGKNYLLPVRLDNYVRNGWHHSLAQTVKDRVIADFSEHEDMAAFGRELAKLISALKAPERVPST